MDSILSAFYACLGLNDHQFELSNPSITPYEEQTMADDILRVLLTAEHGREYLKKSVDDIISTRSWTENIAKRILSGLESALANAETLGSAVKDAMEKALAEATGFARDHPVFMTLVAIGVLVILMPWVLEALGFAELGPIEGSFAAWWQSTYSGYVRKDSLFAFFQRLGMVWRYKLALL